MGWVPRSDQLRIVNLIEPRGNSHLTPRGLTNPFDRRRFYYATCDILPVVGLRSGLARQEKREVPWNTASSAGRGCASQY